MKRVFGMENANWPWKVRACGHLKIVSSCFQSSHSCTHSFFIFLSHCIEIVSNPSCVSNAIEPESGVEIFSYRFTDYGGQSVASGMSITLFLGAFFLLIWRHFRFWHLSNARKVSQKFGMTHKGYFTLTRRRPGTRATIARVARMHARPPLTTENSGENMPATGLIRIGQAWGHQLQTWR